jgi:hypothetical protein
MSVRGTIGTAVDATTSAVRHFHWWLDWHARARPSDGCRAID